MNSTVSKELLYNPKKKKRKKKSSCKLSDGLVKKLPIKLH